MIELFLSKGIELFSFIDTFSTSIILSILSFLLLNPEIDRDLMELEASKVGNIEDYIQEKIHIKRLESISEKDLNNLIKIAKKDNFYNKNKKIIEDLKESICYFHDKEMIKQEFIRISFFKKTGIALIIFSVLIIKLYKHYKLDNINPNFYDYSQKFSIISLAILFNISVLITIYSFYKSIKLKSNPFLKK